MPDGEWRAAFKATDGSEGAEMVLLARTLCVAAGLLAFFVGGARGDILNGNFHSGLDSWDVNLVVDESHVDYGIAEAADEQLHLKARNTYLWDEPSSDWLMQESDLTWMTVSQVGTVPEGMNGFQFDGSVTISGAPASEETSAEAYVMVMVLYNDMAANQYWTFYNSSPWQSHYVAIPDLIAGSTFDVMISAQSGLDLDYAVAGDDYDITVESHLDNFAFTPEPASLAVILLGGLAILRRRR